MRQHLYANTFYNYGMAEDQASLRYSDGLRQRGFGKHQVFFQNASCVVFVIAPLQHEGLLL